MDVSYIRMITLVLAVFLGVIFFIASRKTRIPAIVMLLLGGVLLGPEFLGFIQPDSLGRGLRLIVSFSVAIILFEGGLTLRPEGFGKAPEAIRRLLSLGVLLTWLGTAAMVYWLFDFSISLSLLAGSLVIVTGPTVIAPLLQRINVKEKLHSILHWEGVLIDPIGVFIAILCFEWLNSQGSAWNHVQSFGFRVLIGMFIGFVGGKLVTYSLRKHWIPEDQINIYVFAVAIFIFGVSDLFVHEAGILAVVVAGLIIGHDQPPGIKHIQKFKQEITEIAIALVFILLAATLELKIFLEYGWAMLFLVLGIIFFIRPVSIFLCTMGTTISLKEKLFLSWIAPRGVVAGSMASLFGLELLTFGFKEGRFLEAFTFSVIGSTIILQGFSAGWVAKWLRVEEPEKRGWVIVGAHLFAAQIGAFVSRTTGGTCVYVDTNLDAVNKMKVKGHHVIKGNALNIDILPQEQMNQVGYLLALTDNRDLNQLICEKWSEVIDVDHLFRWSSQSEEIENLLGGSGQPIWQDLPKPSKTSFDIRNRDILLHQRKPENISDELSKKSTKLISKIGSKVVFSREVVSQSPDDVVLLLQRISRHLSLFILQKKMIYFTASSYENLLRQAIAQICESHADIPCEELSEAILQREVNFPTVLSNGILAPHIHYSGITDPVCLIAGVKTVHGTEDEVVSKARLMFVLISPENDPDGHLIMLAEIAKIASVPGMIEGILNAESMELVIRRIKEIE